MMTIKELTAKIRKEMHKKRTKKESLAILVKAEILTKKGELNPKYFSKETIAEDKARRKEKKD